MGTLYYGDNLTILREQVIVEGRATLGHVASLFNVSGAAVKRVLTANRNAEAA